jgi:uncharacterized protein YcaQ
LRIQREKEEKLKQVMQDREDRIKEQVQQKKQHAQKNAAEIEERRKRGSSLFGQTEVGHICSFSLAKRAASSCAEGTALCSALPLVLMR